MSIKATQSNFHSILFGAVTPAECNYSTITHQRTRIAVNGCVCMCVRECSSHFTTDIRWEACGERERGGQANEVSAWFPYLLWLICNCRRQRRNSIAKLRIDSTHTHAHSRIHKHTHTHMQKWSVKYALAILGSHTRLVFPAWPLPKSQFLPHWNQIWIFMPNGNALCNKRRACVPLLFAHSTNCP